MKRNSVRSPSWLVAAAVLLTFGAVGCADADATTATSDLGTSLGARKEAPPEEIQGLYHNTFSGALGGTEWFEVLPVPGARSYRIADLFGGGFSATLAEDGTITLAQGVGSGRRVSKDAFLLRPRLGSSDFLFESVRAPDTRPDFPLEAVSAVSGPPDVAGSFESTTEQLDPRTGEVVGSFRETVTVGVEGTTFRITDPAGLFFQGVFTTSERVAFRSIRPEPSDPRFRSFSGSEINFPQNMVGEATLAGRDRWTARILLQSRTPLGSQTQLVFRFTARRLSETSIPILAPGVDRDR